VYAQIFDGDTSPAYIFFIMTAKSWSDKGRSYPSYMMDFVDFTGGFFAPAMPMAPARPRHPLAPQWLEPARVPPWGILAHSNQGRAIYTGPLQGLAIHL
jgi:hypothetical protein